MRRRLLVVAVVGVSVLAGALATAWPYRDLTAPSLSPGGGVSSQVLGRPFVIRRGAPARPAQLIQRLAALGYRPADRTTPPIGRFHSSGDSLRVHLRSFPTVDGPSAPAVLEVTFTRDRIGRLVLAGEEVGVASLDPPRLGLLVGDELAMRLPVSLSNLPRHVVPAVLAAEDATFFEHPGVSLSGLVRAAWVNLRRGRVSQGGSTVTQQLVKNLYLTPERTLGRKAREGLLSLLVEMRFDKEEILEAYLNSAYWGRPGRVSLIGLGAAARGWLGCEAGELDVAEAALLAGMIRSPGRLDPRSRPAASVARRNEVLRRMLELGWLEQPEYEDAVESEPVLLPTSGGLRTRDYFLEAVRREAEVRFGPARWLADGYSLLTTLDEADLAAARSSLEQGLASLEEQGAKRGLQGALISIDPASGGVLAYVGGRDYSRSQFDRVSQARRQPGSAFKPVIFAAAFANGVATPATLLADAPLVLRVDGRRWSPQNSDGRYRGWITARRALERSINVAAVRLAWGTGWKRVMATAAALGVQSPLAPVPSLALGAFAVSPLELATVYATLAAGGRRPHLHLVRGVLDAEGTTLPGVPLQPPRPALGAAVSYVTSYVLQGVLERGTARSARRLGVRELLAGKTGTSNDGRDSWFVGYSPDRSTLVWVGYDDNRETGLSGARAALPIWAGFTAARRPPDGYRAFEPPAGVTFVAIDPQSGKRATQACPSAMEEVFVAGTGPVERCRLHAAGSARPLRRSRHRRGEAALPPLRAPR